MNENNKLIGTKYGLLTIIDIDESNNVTCKCDCGNELTTDIKKLKYGRQKSCGCLRSESRVKDLSNKRFGKLIAKERTGEKKNKSQVWLCECDCGNTVEVRAGNLTSGTTHSCGCISDEIRKKALKKALEIRQENYVDGTDIYQLAQEPRPNNTSGVVGVLYDKSTNTWKAKIQFKNKKYYLGSSKDKDEAIRLRKEAEEKLHGDFLRWYEENVKSKKKD